MGHLLRDGELINQPTRRYECNTLILGGGAAGLGALWYLAKHGHRDVLLAEGFERNGNNAAYAASDGLKAPSGAHYLALPSKESVYVREMLADFGILQPDGSFRETDLVYAPESRLLYQDKWVEHLLPKKDADSKRFFDLIGRLKQAYGNDGKKIFAIPIALSSADETWRKLDNLTFKQWLEQESYNSPELLWYLDYCCRDDYGQGIGQVSAFAGLHYFAARNSAETVLTWPEVWRIFLKTCAVMPVCRKAGNGRLKVVSVWRSLFRLMLLPLKSNRFQTAGLKCGCVIMQKRKPLPSPHNTLSPPCR